MIVICGTPTISGCYHSIRASHARLILAATIFFGFVASASAECRIRSAMTDVDVSACRAMGIEPSKVLSDLGAYSSELSEEAATRRLLELPDEDTLTSEPRANNPSTRRNNAGPGSAHSRPASTRTTTTPAAVVSPTTGLSVDQPTQQASSSQPNKSLSMDGFVAVYVAFGLIGYGLGWLSRNTLFSTKQGAGMVASLLMSGFVWIASVLAVTIYAELELGITGAPSWIGSCSTILALSFFFGVLRRKQQSRGSETPPH